MKTIQLIKIILFVLLVFSLQVQLKCFAEAPQTSRLTKIKNFFDSWIPNTLRPNYFYNNGFVKYVKFPYKFRFKDVDANDFEYEIRSVAGVNKANGIFQYNIYKDGKFYTTSAGDLYYDQIRFTIPVDFLSENREINTYQCLAYIKKKSKEEIEGICTVIAKNDDGIPETYVDWFTATHFDPEAIDVASVDEQDADSIGSEHKFRPGIAFKKTSK